MNETSERIVIDINGEDEPVFDWKVNRYQTQSENPVPFLKFTLETTRHRIVFGVCNPRPKDMELTVRDVASIAMGKGVVVFQNGSRYRHPAFRMIDLKRLDAASRAANIAELQMDAKAKETSKRRRAGQRNGKLGGRPMADSDLAALPGAMQDIKTRMQNRPELGLKALCIAVRNDEEHKIKTQWENVRKAYWRWLADPPGVEAEWRRRLNDQRQRAVRPVTKR